MCLIYVHARLICSLATSVHDHLITISSCLQQFDPSQLYSAPPHPLIPTSPLYLTPSSHGSLSHTCNCAYVHGLLHVSQLLTNPEVSGTKTTPLHAGILLCVHFIHCHAQCIRYPTQVGGAQDLTQHVATPSNT